MFSHGERDVSDSEDDSDEENDENEIIKVEQLFKIEDLEPSLKRVEEAMIKVQQLLVPEPTSELKYDKCDFQAKNKTGLNMHNEAKHLTTAIRLEINIILIYYILIYNEHHVM